MTDMSIEMKDVNPIVVVADSMITAVWTPAADSWWFPGHFPQQPITPGVLVLRAAEQAAARGYLNQDVVRIKSCRFKRIADPGDQIEYAITDRGDGSVKVASMIGGVKNLDAQFEFGEASLCLDVEPLSLSRGGAIDPQAYIPHRDPFLFLSEVTHLDVDAGEVSARWETNPTAEYVTGGVVPVNVLIEAAAQASACLSGATSPGNLTLFGSIRNAMCAQPPAAGVELVIESKLTLVQEAIANNHVQVSTAAGDVLVDASVVGMSVPSP